MSLSSEADAERDGGRLRHPGELSAADHADDRESRLPRDRPSVSGRSRRCKPSERRAPRAQSDRLARSREAHGAALAQCRVAGCGGRPGTVAWTVASGSLDARAWVSAVNTATSWQLNAPECAGDPRWQSSDIRATACAAVGARSSARSRSSASSAGRRRRQRRCSTCYRATTQLQIRPVVRRRDRRSPSSSPTSATATGPTGTATRAGARREIALFVVFNAIGIAIENGVPVRRHLRAAPGTASWRTTLQVRSASALATLFRFWSLPHLRLPKARWTGRGRRRRPRRSSPDSRAPPGAGRADAAGPSSENACADSPAPPYQGESGPQAPPCGPGPGVGRSDGRAMPLDGRPGGRGRRPAGAAAAAPAARRPPRPAPGPPPGRGRWRRAADGRARRPAAPSSAGTPGPSSVPRHHRAAGGARAHGHRARAVHQGVLEQRGQHLGERARGGRGEQPAVAVDPDRAGRRCGTPGATRRAAAGSPRRGRRRPPESARGVARSRSAAAAPRRSAARPGVSAIAASSLTVSMSSVGDDLLQPHRERGQRRAQLVRGVGGEPALGREHPGDPLGAGVDHLGDPVQLGDAVAAVPRPRVAGAEALGGARRARRAAGRSAGPAGRRAPTAAASATSATASDEQQRAAGSAGVDRCPRLGDRDASRPCAPGTSLECGWSAIPGPAGRRGDRAWPGTLSSRTRSERVLRVSASVSNGSPADDARSSTIPSSWTAWTDACPARRWSIDLASRGSPAARRAGR